MSLLNYNQEFLDLLPVGVYGCLAPSGQILFRNRRAVELWGRDPGNSQPGEVFCGSYRLCRTDGTVLPHSECPMAEAIATGRSFENVQVIVEREDGSRILACVNIQAMVEPSGRILGAVNVFHPVEDAVTVASL